MASDRPPAPSADAGPQGAASIWRFAGLFAAALALLACSALGLGVIGLQYDECLHLAGAVYLQKAPGAPPAFAYPPAAWVPLGERWWPLMVIPYAGALKNYLMITPFAVWGAGVVVARAASALFLAGGIWGVTRLYRSELGGAGSAAAAGILAVHPALLLHSLYDNGTVGVWILLFGLLAAAVERYRRRPDVPAAFWAGLLSGLGLWNRANFLWLLAAVLVACGLVYGRRLRLPASHLASVVAGALAGCAPLLLYQAATGGEILRTWRAGRLDAGLLERLLRRVSMLRETLLIDVENLQIWGGAAAPAWQGAALLLVLAGASALCFWPRGDGDEAAARFRRASALSLLLFLLLMGTSRLNVAPHHLVTALPLVAAVVVAGYGAARKRWRGAPVLAAGTAVLYLALCVHWNVTAARQMRRTGGVGSWSDAIGAVARELRERHPGREVVVLDWGLATNLYVAAGGDVPLREAFWGATREHSGAGPSWRSLVSGGGLFLTNARPHFPASSEGFRAALAKSGSEFARTEFRERSGAPYAELFDVRPASRRTRPMIP